MTEQKIENQLWKLCERIKNGVDGFYEAEEYYNEHHK